MKKLILGCLILINQVCLAEPGPVEEIHEGREIVRAFINNPQISEKLREEYVEDVLRMTKQVLEPGVTKYEVYARSCPTCLPTSAFVTILEDMRPTYADGAIEYEVSIFIAH
ncbi:MAG: hypothetical protein AB7F43_12705 [Bacteriovoracia bacterium]